jgi:hypothetical protein
MTHQDAEEGAGEEHDEKSGNPIDEFGGRVLNPYERACRGHD